VLAEFFVAHGQMLLPLVELIEQSQVVVDEFLDLLGRAALEAVLQLSAEQLAGPRHQGRCGGEVRRHGQQRGTVRLATQKVHVSKPRLRRRGGGPQAEVALPAYEAMQASAPLRDKLLTILLSGVSTRHYEQVVPEMAESCGLKKSSVSREFVQASAAQLRALSERRFDHLDLLVIYLDGKRFGGHQVVVALGVDRAGEKHVLGLAEGATENAVVVTGLLEDLVARGVRPQRRRLFVIDGAKALRQGITAVFGADQLVQRCRRHKIENVLGYLPQALQPQVRATLQAAYRLEAEAGMTKLKQQARWREPEYPSAAASLREGLAETFTINRLGLPPRLRRCLATTNIVESPTADAQLRTGRVTRWRSGTMALRWAAAAYLATEKSFRRLMGYRDLWMLEAALADQTLAQEVSAA
jgi:transposase-like protein